MNNKGFTFLEMIFAVAITLLLVSMATTSFTNYYRSLNAGEFAEQLATNINYAQSYASARDIRVQATFDRDLQRYNFQLIPPDALGNLFLPGTATREGSLPPGFTFAFDGSNPLEVTFNELGFPLAGQDIVLRLTTGSVTRTITIDHKTGLIVIG